jgi:hypothetical protein
MMEKFDGVGVFWDGQNLFTKSSRIPIQIPRDIHFPSIPFEGELWYVDDIVVANTFRMGYNNVERCIQFLRTKSNNRNWKEAKIIIFDSPGATDKPYYERLNLLQNSKLSYTNHSFI